MDKSFSQFSKVVNKHVLGNQDEFTRLKDKLEMCEHATSKAGAAALGYLMAMEEMEELKSEAKPASVYDKVLEVVNGLISANGQHFAESACDEIFTTIYEWLDAEMIAEGFDCINEGSDRCTRNYLLYLFNDYLIKA
jgi:hypothetical protein